MSFLASFIIKPLAYISVPFFIVHRIAVQQKPTPLRYYARLVVFVGALFTVASCNFFVAIGLNILGRPLDTNYYVAFMFYSSIHKLLGFEAEIEGEEHLQQPALIMSNHQSIIDLFILGRLLRKKTVMLAKTSLKYTPLGPFMMLSGNIFIDRSNKTSALRSVEAAGTTMKKEGASVWMYPEGTRHMSPVPDMLPFKKGGFHLAINAGIPIVPIVTENYWRYFHKGVFETGIIKVKILPPIATTSLTPEDINDLSTRVRGMMLETLYEISPKSDNNIPEDPITPLQVPEPLPSASSSISLASSSGGGETEEDEEMVLVGRPGKD